MHLSKERTVYIFICMCFIENAVLTLLEYESLTYIILVLFTFLSSKMRKDCNMVVLMNIILVYLQYLILIFSSLAINNYDIKI